MEEWPESQKLFLAGSSPTFSVIQVANLQCSSMQAPKSTLLFSSLEQSIAFASNLDLQIRLYSYDSHKLSGKSCTDTRLLDRVRHQKAGDLSMPSKGTLIRCPTL